VAILSTLCLPLDERALGPFEQQRERGQILGRRVAASPSESFPHQKGLKGCDIWAETK
jgi:hypothetical protein